MRRTFETIRRRFFPRWDKARRWTCRVNRRLAGDGLCRCDTTTIYVSNPEDENRDAILIHEICHALNPSLNHGVPWQQRMLKAAASAEQFGEVALAKFLRAEVTRYRNDAERVTAPAIYKDIEQFVEESSTIPSARTVVRVLARHCLMTEKEFVQRFPRAEKICKRAIVRREGFPRAP